LEGRGKEAALDMIKGGALPMEIHGIGRQDFTRRHRGLSSLERRVKGGVQVVIPESKNYRGRMLYISKKKLNGAVNWRRVPMTVRRGRTNLRGLYPFSGEKEKNKGVQPMLEGGKRESPVDIQGRKELATRENGRGAGKKKWRTPARNPLGEKISPTITSSKKKGRNRAPWIRQNIKVSGDGQI